MSGIASTFQTAKVLEVLGIAVEFPRLEIYDLSIVSESIKQRKLKITEKLGQKNGLTPFDLFNVQSQIELNDPTVGEILDAALTPNGAADILTRSLKKAGKVDAEAREIIAGMTPHEVVVVAQEIIIFKPLKKEVTVPPNVDSEKPPASPILDTPTLSTSTATSTTRGVTIPAAYGDLSAL